MKEYFADIEKLRIEFDSIERPTLEMESPSREPDTPTSQKPQDFLSRSAVGPAEGLESGEEHIEPSAVKKDQMIDHEAELAKLESEFGKVGVDYTSDEIGGWEFDELEKELATGK